MKGSEMTVIKMLLFDSLWVNLLDFLFALWADTWPHGGAIFLQICEKTWKAAWHVLPIKPTTNFTDHITGPGNT